MTRWFAPSAAPSTPTTDGTVPPSGGADDSRAGGHEDENENDSAEQTGDVAALRSTAANSVKWAMVQMAGATGGRLLFTFVLARLLGPEDFGIVAQAMIYVSLTMVLLDQGFGLALVQRRSLDPDDARSVAALNLVLALAFMVITLLAAPFVADFFGTPELTAVLRVLALGLIVKALGIVPVQLCRRAFQFRELALLQTGAVLVGGVLGVVSAELGVGYWALVIQIVTADVLMLIGLYALRGLPRFRFDLQRLRGMFAFSIGIVGAELLAFSTQNVDNIAIGKVLGPTALAFYALSFRIQRFPIQLIGSVVNDVALPVFSRLQDDRRLMGQWFCTATRFVTLLTWPPLVLMTVSAPVAVPFVFGDRWEPAVTPMQLLGVAGLAVVARWLFRPLLTACGRTDVLFFWSLLQVGLLTVAVLVSVQWGIDAVAASAALVAVTLAFPQSVSVARIVGFSLRSYYAAQVPAAAAGVVLAVTWAVVAALLEGAGAGPLVVLIVATAVALAAYVGTARLVRPTVFSEVGEMFTLASRNRGRRPAGAAGDDTAEESGSTGESDSTSAPPGSPPEAVPEHTSGKGVQHRKDQR